MTREEFIQKLCSMQSYTEFILWAMETPGTSKELYEQCPEVYWLDWLIERSNVEFRGYHDNVVEMDQQLGPIEAKFNQEMALVEDEFRQAKVEYDRKMNIVRNEYNQKSLEIIKSVVPWDAIEDALTQ